MGHIKQTHKLKGICLCAANEAALLTQARAKAEHEQGAQFSQGFSLSYVKTESALHLASARLSFQLVLWQEWEEASHHQTARLRLQLRTSFG